MKLFKDEEIFMSRKKLKQVCLAVSIMTLLLYIVAMIFSLNGSTYFILNYQNTQMDNIESFMRAHGIQSLISAVFLVLEFSIIESFISNRMVKLYYPLILYGILVGLAFAFPTLPSIVYSLIIILSYLFIPIIENLITNKKFVLKEQAMILLRFGIATIISLTLQGMILVIKAGYFDGVNHIMTMSAHFIYAIEYDIALSVLLFTAALYIDREKGDSESWAIYHTQSGSSQTLKTKSQRSSIWKNLTKRQKNRLIGFFIKLYLIQLLGFAIIMIIPFITGKVFEYLVMYLAFCVTRYLLGFKYSLHFKSETVCLTVGAVVFGLLTLAVPFFYVLLIIAVLLGSGLAVFLHLSYKYRGFWLFTQMAKPDKFAALYTIFEGDLSEQHIMRQCKYKGLDKETSRIVEEYMEGYKLSYLAHRFNYSVKTLDRKLTDAIKILNR